MGCTGLNIDDCDLDVFSFCALPSVSGDRAGIGVRLQPDNGQAGEEHAPWWRGDQLRRQTSDVALSDGRPLSAADRLTRHQLTGTCVCCMTLLCGLLHDMSLLLRAYPRQDVLPRCLCEIDACPPPLCLPLSLY